MHHLVSSCNRDDFQPELRAFLSATQNLKMLRYLVLESDRETWTAPQLHEEQRDGRIEIVDLAGQVRGFREILPLPARPGEPQMRLCYDWFWSEFAKFLHEKQADEQVWAYPAKTEFVMFYPADLTFCIENEWESFWNHLSSEEHLKQSMGIYFENKTFVKKRGSAKLLTPKNVPLLSEAMAQFLIDFYKSPSVKRIFKTYKRSTDLIEPLPAAFSALKEAKKKGEWATIPIRQVASVEYVKGGDLPSGRQKDIRCGGCGKIIPKNGGFDRLPILLKDADERPQSGTNKDKGTMYCGRCVATVLLCPVKLTPETLAVRFQPQGGEKPGTTWLIEQSLKRYVAQSLNVQSGGFINLHLTESVDRKPLADVWGAYHYALWKIATLFAPELFAQKDFEVEVYPGEETFTLPRWALWLVSSFSRWDTENVFQYKCYAHKDKGYRNSFTRFLRLLSRKKVFEAWYTLIVGNVIYAKDNKGNLRNPAWKPKSLQEIWSAFEQILQQKIKKEDVMSIPDYPRIAGMTGLLLPFAERVKSVKKNEDDRRVVIKKLLQNADKPIPYVYTAVREGESDFSDCIFCKQAGNRYFFDKALDLLKWAGEDVERLKQEAEERTKDKKWERIWQFKEKIFLGPDQIMRVVSALRNEEIRKGERPPYKNEADWRTFAYQVKLALWSMFPQYLGSQD